MIQNLPDGYRMVFNMHEIEGYSYDEIAKVLECTPTTCRTQLFRAKKILQEKLTELYNKQDKH
jgi:RNA polymerase sigma-70 factor (ECF subfamily)